jgi:hypothetical protein
MDEDWTPEEKAEWQNRWASAAPGSQEQALLDEMKWTGVFLPLNQASPVSLGSPVPGQSTEPSPVSQSPTGPPPLFPVVSPAQDPQEALKKAQMNAFFSQGKRLTPEEEAAVVASAQPAPRIPPGGIGFGTRRQVGPLGSGRTKTRKAKKGGEIVSMFFNIRDQVKLYHWQTKSFAEHKATDDLVGTLDTNIDKFVESYMGRYGRPYIKKTLPVKNLTVTGIRTFISKSDEWLAKKLPRMLKRGDSDLLNIRDEILADLNQVKYLFTLS